MGFWKQGMAVAVVGLGLMSGEVHAQSAEDFLSAQQVAEPPAPLARDTSDDFTLQSFAGRSVLPVKPAAGGGLHRGTLAAGLLVLVPVHGGGEAGTAGPGLDG